jgi:hypothetical protein
MSSTLILVIKKLFHFLKWCIENILKIAIAIGLVLGIKFYLEGGFNGIF